MAEPTRFATLLVRLAAPGSYASAAHLRSCAPALWLPVAQPRAPLGSSRHLAAGMAGLRLLGLRAFTQALAGRPRECLAGNA